MQVELPPKLIDAIIYNFRTDRKTLFYCALVCHGWLDRCRYYLFRQITVTAHPRTPNVNTDNLLDVHTFLVRLRSRRHLAHYVRQVRIERRHTHGGEGQRVALPVIVVMLRMLPELRQLHLIEVLLYPLNNFPLESHRGSFSLARLSLQNVAATSVGSIIDVLSLFASIETLAISHFKGDLGPWRPSEISVSQKMKVARLLTFHVSDVESLAKILDATVEMTEVKHVGFTIAKNMSSSHTNSMLRMMSPIEICSLEFDCRRCYTPSTSPIIEKLMFQPFNALETIRFHIALDKRVDRVDEQWECLISSLTVIPRSSVKTLSIHIHFDSMGRDRLAEMIEFIDPDTKRPSEHLFSLEWSAFTTMVSSMSNLQTLSFHIAFNTIPMEYTARESQEYDAICSSLVKIASREGWQDRLAISRQIGIWESLDGVDRVAPPKTRMLTSRSLYLARCVALHPVLSSGFIPLSRYSFLGKNINV
ncbi:hypothetical protein QCA50_007625 [Cerrena zonata]|uniref:F-box domain-containing protein n=1 Tax=Cerrena zonata TaxID=2478898 RepID=A0AAW0GBB8_9APHY